MQLFAAIFAVFLICGTNTASAFRGPVAGVTVSNEGWAKTNSTGLGENTVYVDANKVSLDNALAADISTTGDIELVEATRYTLEQMTNGTYDSERNSAYTLLRLSDNYTGMRMFVVKRSKIMAIQDTFSADTIPTGHFNIDGTAKFKIRNAAKDQYGQEYDLELTISDVEIYLNGRHTSTVSLFRRSNHAVFNMLQERPVSTLRALKDDDDNIVDYEIPGFSVSGKSVYDGAEYVTTVKLYKAGTNTLIDAENSAMAMSFHDIDGADNTLEGKIRAHPEDHGISVPYRWTTIPSYLAAGQGGITLNIDRTGLSDRYLAQNGSSSRYSEGIEIISGLKENKVFSFKTNNETLTTTDDQEGTYLYFEETSRGGLRITGTASTGGANQPSSDTTRVLLLADARGFSYRYSGTGCGTGLGFVGVKKVVTQRGTNANHLEITDTDNEVTWRENKTIEIAVDKGYYIPSVVIDGQTLTSNALTPAGKTAAGWHKFTYTFNDVVDDHSILVNADTLPTANLRIEKKGYGNYLDSSRSFDITLTVTNDEDEPIAGSFAGVKELKTGNVGDTFTFANGETTFALKVGESVEISLPIGYNWRVNEADYSAEGITVAYEHQTGQISGTSDNIATISNTHELPVETGVASHLGPQLFIISGMILAGFGVRGYIKTRKQFK